MLQSLLTLDGNILLWIQNNLRSDVLTPIVVFITRLGDVGFIWIVGILILSVRKQTRKTGVMTFSALFLSALAVSVVLKNVVARVRPYEVVQGLTSLIGAQKDYSFPSGHTAGSFAAAVVMFKMLPKKIGVPAVVLAFLIGLSRLYVGVHYLSDVIFGALVGTVIAIIVVAIEKRIFSTHGKKTGNYSEQLQSS